MDPVVPDSSSVMAEDKGLGQNGKPDGEQAVSCTTTATATAVTASSTSSNGRTRVKVDGLAVTMDGREEEADIDMMHGAGDPTSGKTAEEQQDEAAQDLDERRQSQLRKQNRFTKASVLIPPENFAIVEDGLYRSVS